MKKFLLFFIVSVLCVGEFPALAITINKAAPVATQETSSSSTMTSLVPTVLNLVSGVQQLSAQQKELTAECIPTSQEITFVDTMVKEWAKTGAMTADEVEKRLGMKRCSTAVGGYESSVELFAATDTDDTICYDYFAGSGNDGMVWEKFPKVGKATYCSDGSPAGMCSDKYKVTVSNIYDIFNLIDFSDADYATEYEVTMAGKLTAKIEKCSYAKLSSKKREMWGEFLMGTINNLGQPTNTGSIMESVSSITTNGLGGGLSSIGSLATSLFAN